MYCQNCGSALSQDARFCQSCGKAQSPLQPLPPVPPPPVAVPITRTIQPQQKPKSKTLWIVIGGVLLLVVIIGILGKSPSDNSGTEGGREPSATTASGPTPQEAQFNALTPSEHLVLSLIHILNSVSPPPFQQYKGTVYVKYSLKAPTAWSNGGLAAAVEVDNQQDLSLIHI